MALALLQYAKSRYSGYSFLLKDLLSRGPELCVESFRARHNPVKHCHKSDWGFILPQSNPVMFLCIWVLHLNSLLVTATLNQLVGGLLVGGAVKELSFGLRNTHPRPSAARSL